MIIENSYPITIDTGPTNESWHCGECEFLHKVHHLRFDDLRCLLFREILEFDVTEHGPSLECVRCPGCLNVYPRKGE